MSAGRKDIRIKKEISGFTYRLILYYNVRDGHRPRHYKSRQHSAGGPATVAGLMCPAPRKGGSVPALPSAAFPLARVAGPAEPSPRYF